MVAALAATAVAMLSMLVAAPVEAQTAATGCPPGQPLGFPPGRVPDNAATPTNRPAYPPGRCQLALSQSAAPRGEGFRVTGGGFVPGETVELRLAGLSMGSVVADAGGAFATDVVVPQAAPLGRTEVSAAAASQTLAADFEVLGATAAAPAAGGSTLPRTGRDVLVPASAGVGLVGVGTVLALASRRRRVQPRT
jgi:hypothetical protein